ncbi:MAG: hypothetical protein R2753_05160 [Chitinophagales bacterium]
MTKNNTESTPLSVWITLVGLMFILAGAFFLFGESIRATVISKEINGITNASTCEEENVKIFAFGSSMFRTGIANRFDAPKWIPDSSNYCLERTGFLNLTLASTIRNKQILKAIGNTNADLILVESAVLQYKSRSENRLEEGRPRQTIRMIKQFLEAKERFAMDDYPKPFYGTQLNAASEQEEVEKALVNRQLRDIQEITTFLTQLKNEAKDAKIIIIDIPRPALIESALDERDKQQLEAYKNNFQSMDIDYWEFNQLMNKAYFFDVIHLNDDGQKMYMDWLINQIENEIKR